ALVGALLLLKECHAGLKQGLSAVTLRPLLLAGLVLAAPFVVGILWTIFSDIVKAENEIGARLTSSRLVPWLFGSWEQRVGARLWLDVISRRVLADTFGYAAIPAVALIGLTLFSRKYGFAVLVALVAFLVPFLVFTNLHIVHTY